MNFLITGANGFIGRSLVARLIGAMAATGKPSDRDLRLTLLDLAMEPVNDERVRVLSGDIADPALLARAFETPVDVVFHLASVPGGLAEKNYELGREVNLDATVRLLEAAGCQKQAPVFVFASSIAVLGTPLPAQVNDETAPLPSLSYGAQKLIGEILVQDFSRRGKVDGRSIRLPGIVARPPQRTGQMSAFMSDILREPAAGRPFVCPVSAGATTWLMSARCIVDNLLHAATMPIPAGRARRSWTLPALRASMAELIEASAQVHGEQVRSLVTYASTPDAALEADFGNYPPLSTSAAEAAGFRHDHDLQTLIRRALDMAVEVAA